VRLLLEAIPLLLIIVVPMSVHAGVLASIIGVWENGQQQGVAVAEAAPQTLSLLRAAVNVDPSPAVGGGDIFIEDGALVAGNASEGKDSKNSRTTNGEISVYVVREGDTLSQIAEMFGVSSKTILWANDIKDSSVIQPGMSLVILPITGISHVVQKGETVGTIAKKYQGEVQDILSYNQVASADDIKVGDTLVIPGGEIPAPKAPAHTTVASHPSSGTTVTHSSSGGSSSWLSAPLDHYIKTQGIHGYNAVDLAAPVGTPIHAAAAGTVIVAKTSGWNGGYGLYVVVKHPNGVQTLYAHMSRDIAQGGERVVAGQTLGYVGVTGKSTGPHLHFEVRGARNPF
jgi:LysM repeat protein